MLEIHLLEQLVAFAETGALSRAAEELHTSQPALTRAMKKLEAELGVALFVRTKNHLALNETGRVAAEYAAHVLKEEAYFEERVRAFDRSLHTLSIGYCAPVPQWVLTPLINGVFEGMTISADMGDDRDFLARLAQGTYQLAVTHEPPTDEKFFYQKCGHEDLFLSLLPSDPLAFYPEIHLRDIDGRSVLLLSRIGFWDPLVRQQTPHTQYLVQIEETSFVELREHSAYPAFSSSYFLRRGQGTPGRIQVALADPECHTDYYLVCLAREKERFARLFSKVGERTIA